MSRRISHHPNAFPLSVPVLSGQQVDRRHYHLVPLSRGIGQAGIERLAQYMTRCLFSLSPLVKVSDTGQIVYHAEKQACRAFPDTHRHGDVAYHR
jgi:hypothetical protein